MVFLRPEVWNVRLFRLTYRFVEVTTNSRLIEQSEELVSFLPESLEVEIYFRINVAFKTTDRSSWNSKNLKPWS